MRDFLRQGSFDLSFEKISNVIGELRWIGFESTKRQIEIRLVACGGVLLA